VLSSPVTPSFSPTEFTSIHNTLFPTVCQHVFSLCVRHRTAALAQGITTQVIFGQTLCH
jgi:hypothetical protein